MAYKALYRIYRPQTFQEVAGQKYIVKTLEKQIKEGKTTHAYLFSGPRGTGKTTMAKIFAKAINCESGDNVPCNECENCKEITIGSHPDIIEIDAASNTSVDNMRELIEKTKYLPSLGKYKVYIIDECHMLSNGAWNALLKTLEEPPAHVIFILATTDVQKVIPTIISRCQRFDFGKINKYDMKERLTDVLTEEEIECSDEALDLVIELADGGMRDALSILDQTIAYSGTNISAQDVKDVYGVGSLQDKIDLIEIVASNDVEQLLLKSDEYEKNGIDVSRETSGIIDILKDVVVYKNTKKENLLKVLNEEQVINLCNKLINYDINNMILALVKSIDNFKKSNNVKTIFEVSMMNLMDIKQETKVINEVKVVDSKIENTSPRETVKRPSVEVEKKEVKPDVKIEVKEVVKPVEVINNNVIKENKKIVPTEDDIINIFLQATKDAADEVRKKWPLIKGYVGHPKYNSVVGLLSDSVPSACSSNCILIVSSEKCDAALLQSAKNIKLLQEFFEDLYGSEMDYYSITKKEFDDYKLKYLKLRQAGKLPEKKEIVKRVIEITDTVSEAEEFGKSVFGDILEIEEE